MYSKKGRAMRLLAAICGASQALFAASPAHADGRFASVAEALTSPEFIDDCIGRDGGTILLSFSPTYGTERLVIVAALKQQILDTGAADDVREHDPADWSAAAACNTQIPPGPRAVIFVRLLRDEEGAFRVARVLVRTKDRCKKTSLERGYYPDRCSDARTSKPRDEKMPLFVRRGLAVSTPARVRLAPSPSQQRARDRVKGLLTGVVMQAGMVLGLRVAQAGIVEDDPESAKLIGAVAYTSTLGLTTLSAYTARAWVEKAVPPWRRRIALGWSGAVLLTVGGVAVATTEYVTFMSNKTDSQEVAGLRMVQALGEFSIAAGVGLITFAVRPRVSLSPSMAGVTISGRF